jgi:LysR family transcriptional regulator, carnitine catabolism transcriptional activator
MEYTSRQLRAFHLVADHRNFTRAAEALFLTPSGLSVLIRELERQLGFRLFHRTTRKVVLTPQGSELLEITRPALNMLDEGMSRIEQAARRRNRSISVGTTPWLAAHVLPSAIREFRDRFPGLQIHLFDGNLTALAKRVEANRLNFALGIFDRILGMRRVPFFRFSLMLAQPDDGRPVRPHSSSWIDLEGETLISLTRDYPYEQLIQKQLAKTGVTCKRGQTVNGLDTQIGLVEAGLGVAVIPSFGVMASRSRRVRVTRLEPEVALDFYEISNRGRKLPPEASGFASFLKTYLARRVGEHE